MSFSSFRPAGKPNSAESVSNILQYRPDSATSTSSYCSTPSSVMSVIYKPYGDVHSNNSPCVVSYDSSSEQTSGSGSNSTITPSVSVGEIQNENTFQKRDSSPALSSCSSASSKSGKQKKKVSFSDSEPPDTPSPLNCSTNSSQAAYFDMKHSEIGNMPSRAINSNLGQQTQYSHQNSSNSSLDSIGVSKSNNYRPPPPSYQYAIRNSAMLSKSMDESKMRPMIQQQTLQQSGSFNSSQTLQQSSSSTSSLNNSFDDVNVNKGPPMSPGRNTINSTNSQNSPFRKNQPSVPNTSTFILQNQPDNKSTVANVLNHQNFTDNTTSSYQNVQYPQQEPVTMATKSPWLPGQSSFQRSQQHPATPPSASTPNRSNIPFSGTRQANTFYPASPRRVQNNLTPQMSPVREQPTAHSQFLPNSQRPNTLNLGLSKPAVLTDPLLTDSTISPQEYFPPPPPQFREKSDNNSIAAHSYDSQISGNTGEFNQAQRYNFSNGPNQYLESNTNPTQGHVTDRRSYVPSSQMEMKEFPRHNGSNVSMNQNSPNQQPTRGPQIPASPIRSPQKYSIHTPTNQIQVPRVSTNQKSELPVRKNPPLPPARIDSWESMDKRVNGQQNNSVINEAGCGRQNFAQTNKGPAFYGQNGPPLPPKGQNLVLNKGVISNQNGGIQNGLPTAGTMGNQMYTSQVTNSNGGQMPNQLTNGIVSNFRNNPVQNGGLRRVNLGSDKKSFAKTNVIQSSKC